MNRLSLFLAAGSAIIAMAGPCAATDKGQAANERLLLIHAVPASTTVPDAEKTSQQSVYDGIVEYLTDKGYRVVDKASAEQCSLQIAATHDIDPHLNKAASFGLKFFAEYTIFFKTATVTKDNDNGKGALVRANAKIVDTTSSRIITAKSAEASSAGLSLDAAMDKAGRAAGKKLAASLAAAMEKSHRESAAEGKVYTVVFESPEAGEHLLSFLSRLELSNAVSGAREVESGGGKATIEVNYRGKRDQLDRDILQTAAELGWKLQRVRSEGNRSTWKMK